MLGRNDDCRNCLKEKCNWDIDEQVTKLIGISSSLATYDSMNYASIELTMTGCLKVPRFTSPLGPAESRAMECIGNLCNYKTEFEDYFGNR